MFKLILEEVSPDNYTPSTHVWPVRITATDMDDEPVAIFRYQELAAPVAGSAFNGVVNAMEMTELGIDAPSPGSPFFRKSECFVSCRSPQHASELWTTVQRFTKDLARNLSRRDDMAVSQTVTITP